ncbi:MAG: pentapeptide repeat-containing protein [Elainella sp. Prado103]|jgi:hypothetical protein|nr:pentapeptide repeat-containing protein [Elainella sp. Prado103]
MTSESLDAEIKKLREFANELLDHAKISQSETDATQIAEKAAAFLKLAAELERTPFDLEKLNQEAQKLRRENDTAQARERSEKIRDYVALLTPIITVITLAATLASQTYQFTRTEQAKQVELLDLQWRDALKTVSDSGELSPGIIAIQPFLRSEKYETQAKDLAVNLLSTSSDVVFFQGLFGSAFTPVTWENVERIVQINRAIATRVNPVLGKSWDPSQNINNISLLTPEERKTYDYAAGTLPVLSAQIGALLKTGTKPPKPLDLSGARIHRADWNGVNLQDTRLDNAQIIFTNVKDADFSDVRAFAGAYFYGTAWWNAKAINKSLLNYLQSSFPFDPKASYGPNYESQTQDNYDAQVKRLLESSTR